MKIFGFISRRMVAKIFLGIGLVVGAALLWQARLESRRAERALRDETRGAASAVARSVVGAVESTMLQGDGILVKDLVASIKRRAGEADIHVYDPRGVEVFAPRGPAPDPASLPPDVAAALADGRRRTTADSAVLRPVPTEERCKECHADERPLRGLLHVAFGDACSDRRDRALARVVANGFVHVMTARRQDLLDEFFRELAERAPSIHAVEVYDRDGDPIYGAAIAGVPADVTRAALDPAGDRAPRSAAGTGGPVELVPLPTEPRCVECHDDGLPMRGLLAVAFAPGRQGCSEADFEAAVDTSLRYIMMSRLGGLAGQFLDSAVATGAIDRVVLYDGEGRVFWDTRHPPPPLHVAGALASGAATAEFLGSGADERVRVVEPLHNEPACSRCHGSDPPRRGAVEVSLSTANAALMRDEQYRSRAIFTGYTLVGILVMLGSLLQYLVVRPVKRVAAVAEAVGAGDLSRTVSRADPDGDEVSQLGHRINAMVDGLRAKLHLEKFVSRGAVAAAEGAGLQGVTRKGVRRAATVLFSDVRGFTAFSESVAAETVVEELNRLLHAQTEVVQRHDGDIDKYVGDELMAVFQGPDAAARAVRCAIEMVESVGAGAAAELSVGVGLACGDVVYGAIGHEQRMDFTVIGDVVNTGARLCAVAERGQVLVTEAVAEACRGATDIALVEREPKSLKGKKQPVRVFEAKRA